MFRVLATTVALILSGCSIVSQPPRPFTADAFRESGGVAYLWSAGKVRQPVVSLQDFAIITRIDDKPIPSKHRPGAGTEPLVAWRIDIPAGKHVIEILNKECVLDPFSGIGGCSAVEKSSHQVEFTAAPGRAYTPIVDEKCGRKWFWIADTSQVNSAAAETTSPLPFIEIAPAVGGVRPPEGPCPESTTEAVDSH